MTRNSLNKTNLKLEAFIFRKIVNVYNAFELFVKYRGFIGICCLCRWIVRGRCGRYRTVKLLVRPWLRRYVERQYIVYLYIAFVKFVKHGGFHIIIYAHCQNYSTLLLNMLTNRNRIHEGTEMHWGRFHIKTTLFWDYILSELYGIFCLIIMLTVYWYIFCKCQFDSLWFEPDSNSPVRAVVC